MKSWPVFTGEAVKGEDGNEQLWKYLASRTGVCSWFSWTAATFPFSPHFGLTGPAPSLFVSLMSKTVKQPLPSHPRYHNYFSRSPALFISFASTVGSIPKVSLNSTNSTNSSEKPSFSFYFSPLNYWAAVNIFEHLSSRYYPINK